MKGIRPRGIKTLLGLLTRKYKSKTFAFHSLRCANKIMDSYNSPSTKPLLKGTQIVWYFLSLLEILLAFRFVLRLTGANAGAGFTSLVYSLAWPFNAPFLTVFPGTYVQGGVFEWTTLLAMFVYWVIAFAIVRLFLMSKTVSTSEAAAKLDKQDK